MYIGKSLLRHNLDYKNLKLFNVTEFILVFPTLF